MTFSTRWLLGPDTDCVDRRRTQDADMRFTLAFSSSIFRFDVAIYSGYKKAPGGTTHRGLVLSTKKVAG